MTYPKAISVIVKFMDLRVKEPLMDFSDDVGEDEGEKLFLESLKIFVLLLVAMFESEK